MKANEVAIAQLAMAFETNDLINKIYLAQDTDWPNGLAWKVVRDLMDEFHPTDIVSKVELKIRMNKVRMGKKDSPKVLFDQISAIKNAYDASNHIIDEEDLIAVVLDKAPFCTHMCWQLKKETKQEHWRCRIYEQQ